MLGAPLRMQRPENLEKYIRERAPCARCTLPVGDIALRGQKPLPTHSLRRPNRTSQRPPLAALATSAAPESPVAVVINAVMLAGQTAHQLMRQQLATQRGLLVG